MAYERCFQIKCTRWPDCGIINPLTPRGFCQKCIFWTFWRFSGWIWAKLASIYSKMHLLHDGMPFFLLASCFTTLLLGHAKKSKLWYVLSLFVFFFKFFFGLSFFSFLVQSALLGWFRGMLFAKALSTNAITP